MITVGWSCFESTGASRLGIVGEFVELECFVGGVEREAGGDPEDESVFGGEGAIIVEMGVAALIDDEGFACLAVSSSTRAYRLWRTSAVSFEA